MNKKDHKENEASATYPGKGKPAGGWESTKKTRTKSPGPPLMRLGRPRASTCEFRGALGPKAKTREFSGAPPALGPWALGPKMLNLVS